MALQKLLEFALQIKAVGFQGAAAAVQGLNRSIEQMNKSVRDTAHLREAAGTMATVGAGALAMGGAVAYGLKSAIDSAAATDEAYRHLSLALDTGTAGIRELAQAHEFAAAASVKFNYAQTDVINNLYKSQSFIGNWNAALAVTNQSLAIAKGNMGDAASVSEQLSIMFNDFGDKSKPAVEQAKQLADLVAYTSRHGAFDSVNQLMGGVSTAIGSAKAAGMGAKDLLATLQGFSQVGLVGTEAGEALEESLAAFAHGKLQSELGVALATTKTDGLDVIGTFVNLRREVGSGTISIQQFQHAAKALGIRGDRALAVNIDQLLAFRKQLDSGAVNGAAMQGAQTMLGSFGEQIGILGKKWDLLSEALGKPLLGPVAAFAGELGKAIGRVTQFANTHPRIVKFALAFTAAAAAITMTVGAALVAAGAVAAFISVAPAVAAFAGAWGIVAGGVGLATAAIVGLLAVFPELRAFAASAFTAGAHIVEAIAEGMWSEVTRPVKAIAGIVEKLDAYLPHSPAKEGPLRNLHRVRIVQTLAEAMQPAPMVAAIRRVATVATIAAPLMFAPGAMAATRASRSGSNRALVEEAAPRSGGVNITINYSPKIEVRGNSSIDFTNELDKHAEKIVKLIEDYEARLNRKKF